MDMTEFSYISYKLDIHCEVLMNNKYTIALYTAIISSVLVASMFAISYVQLAAAQGNQTGGGGSAAGGNKTGGGGNQTSGAGSTSGKMTGAGPVTGGATSGSSK
jgi:hypothetical protein